MQAMTHEIAPISAQHALDGVQHDDPMGALTEENRTLAVNVTNSRVEYKVAEVRQVPERTRDGVRRVIKNVYVQYSIEPGEIRDVGAYAAPRATDFENNARVDTVIERCSRGKVVPVWRPKAQAYLRSKAELEERREREARMREAALEDARHRFETGLSDRGLSQAQIFMATATYVDKQEVLRVMEDHQTVKICWEREVLTFSDGLDMVAAAVKEAMAPAGQKAKGKG